MNVDVPFDRLAERNSYRARLSRKSNSRARSNSRRTKSSRRARELASVGCGAADFEISQLGVRLAERRVEEQTLLSEVGRAKAQDQVDAQNDLITSKNQLTQALVSHTISRLQFWASTGILYIKDNGNGEN